MRSLIYENPHQWGYVIPQLEFVYNDDVPN